jgi:hypothetical protein
MRWRGIVVTRLCTFIYIYPQCEHWCAADGLATTLDYVGLLSAPVLICFVVHASSLSVAFEALACANAYMVRAAARSHADVA